MRGTTLQSISDVTRAEIPRGLLPRDPLEQKSVVWYVSDCQLLPPPTSVYPIRYTDPGRVLERVAAKYGPSTGLRVLADNIAGVSGWKGLPFSRQYHAVTEGAGAFPCGGMRYLRVSGPDAGLLLDSLTPRDVSSLPVGRATFVIFTTPAGTVDTEAIILRTAPTEYLVSVGGDATDPTWLSTALSLFGRATVSCAELTSFNLKGPLRRRAMRELVHPDDRSALATLAPFHVRPMRTRDGDPVWILRTLIGMEMWGVPERIARVWQRLLEEPLGVVPCGWDALDTFRIECREMVFGLCPLDLHGGTTLAEVGQGQMVDPEKRIDYVGRAALQRDARTPPAQWLAGIETTEDPEIPLQVGDALVARDGEPAGFLTSVAFSPKRGRWLGFAHLRPSCVSGDSVFLLDGYECVVRELPHAT